MLGKLTVQPISAQLVKDKDVVGYMDPYVNLRLGDQYFQTVPAVNQGQNPVWNEQFTFNISSDDTLHITVMDKDVGKDDFLGKLNLRVAQITQKPHSQGYFDLHSKFLGRNVGRILLSFDWFPQERPIVIPPQHGFVMPAQTTQVITSQTSQPIYIQPSTQQPYAQSQLNQHGYVIPPQQTGIYTSQPYQQSQGLQQPMRTQGELYSQTQTQNLSQNIPSSTLGYRPTEYKTVGQYSTVGTQNQPYYTLGVQNQPYTSLGSQSQPYSTLVTQNQPYSNLSMQNQPYSNLSTQNQPYSNLSTQNQPYSSLSTQNQPYSSLRTQNQPYSSISAQNQSYSSLSTQNQPYSIRSSLNTPYSTLGVQNQPYSSPTAQTQQYVPSTRETGSYSNPPYNQPVSGIQTYSSQYTSQQPSSYQQQPTSYQQQPLSSNLQGQSYQTTGQDLVSQAKGLLNQTGLTSQTDYQSQPQNIYGQLGTQGQSYQGYSNQGRDVIVTKREEIIVEEFNKTHPQSNKPVFLDQNAQVSGSHNIGIPSMGTSANYSGRDTDYEARRM